MSSTPAEDRAALTDRAHDEFPTRAPGRGRRSSQGKADVTRAPRTYQPAGNQHGTAAQIRSRHWPREPGTVRSKREGALEPLSVAAGVGLVAYFLGVLAGHLRVGDTKNLMMPVPPLLLSVAVLVLSARHLVMDGTRHRRVAA